LDLPVKPASIDSVMAGDLPNPTDTHVGARTRLRRKMLGMSLEALAAALGITYQQVQKYEKGANRVSASRLRHIAHVLRVPESYFFEGAPGGAGFASSPSADVSAFVASNDGVTLVKAFTAIKNRKLRHRVVDLVEEIAAEKF
jgi:transcriptional regulator with XRE-family HTH domain